MRRAVAVVVGAVGVLALAGCGGSQQHVLDICGDVTEGTAELARYDPATPVSALPFAIGRFDLVEEAVSKARETGLPSGVAPTLRRVWLEPAVASMSSWDSRLEALRTAVSDGGREQVDAALGAALALGTEGVDTGALRQAGYGACATAFTAPTVGSATG